MLQKKICLLGSYAVGKTSLIRRLIHSTFEYDYLTTVGVKIDKRIVSLTDQEVQLLVWDIHGEDRFQKVRSSFIRGASGYLLVIDGTRPETLDTGLLVQQEADSVLGDVPFITLINKHDLQDEWRITDGQIRGLVGRGWTVRETSAKTGDRVDEAFAWLAQQMLNRDRSVRETRIPV